jgi:hypothetical protein
MAMHLSVDLINREVIYGGTVTAFWVPLARSICFGLTFATVLTLIVTPAMLALPLRLKDMARRALGRPTQVGESIAPVDTPLAALANGEQITTVVVPLAVAERARRVS